MDILPKGKTREALRLCLPPLLTLLLLLAFLAWMRRTGWLEILESRDRMEKALQGYGAWAPLGFLGFLALRPFTLIPGVLFAPVAAALFGPHMGTVWKVCGETLGASLAFLAMRFGWKRSLHAGIRGIRKDPGKWDRIGNRLRRRGFLAVLALRLNLLLPFDALNFGLGLSPVRFRDYLSATLLGILPGTWFYVAVSEAAMTGEGWRAAVFAGGILAMVLLSIPLARDLLQDEDPAPLPRDSEEES